jgi:hypothetical protein
MPLGIAFLPTLSDSREIARGDAEPSRVTVEKVMLLKSSTQQLLVRLCGGAPGRIRLVRPSQPIPRTQIVLADFERRAGQRVPPRERSAPG